MCVAPRAGEGEKQDDVDARRGAAKRLPPLAAEHPGRSIGVLVRRNQAVRQLIHRLRSRHHVAASEEGGNPLVDSPAVADRAVGIVAGRSSGRSAWRDIHVANSPLGPVVGVLDHDDDRAAARRHGPTAAAIARRRLWPHAVGLGTNAGRPSATSTICGGWNSWWRWRYTLGQRAGVRPGQFVAFVRETKVEDPTATQVRVMTVHQAKGLQFDIVVLPELDRPLKGKAARTGGRPAGGRSTRSKGFAGMRTNRCGHCCRRSFKRFLRSGRARRSANRSACCMSPLTRAVHALAYDRRADRVGEGGGKPRTFPKTFAGISAARPGRRGRAA